MGDQVTNENFQLRNISQNDLDYNNLFREIALKDYKLLKLWNLLKESDKLVKFKTLNVEIRHDNEPAQGGGEFRYLCLNSSDSEVLRSDKWIVEKIKRNKIVARNIETRDLMEIPKNSTIQGFRRFIHRSNIDVSELKEYVVIKDFKNSHQFLNLSGLRRLDWDRWKSWILGRTSNLSILTRFNISAPGTRLLSFFSGKPRAWSRAGVSAIKNLSNEEAKIVALWINSTMNLLQILVERRETEGAWMGMHKFILEDMRVLSGLNLSKTDKKKLLRVFDEVSKVEFPSVVAQLAMSSEIKEFTQNDLQKISDTFEGFEDCVGEVFEPRRKIDYTILKVLGYNPEEILDGLYSSLLKEILMLKTMMGTR